jgi:hypothetical protein
MSVEPVVWSSTLKFIRELKLNTKVLLEAALLEANGRRGRRMLKGTKNALPSHSDDDGGAHDATISEVNPSILSSDYNLQYPFCCYASRLLGVIQCDAPPLSKDVQS